MGKTLLYARVSTDDQAESGLGLNDQLSKLRAMATVKDLDDTVELVDDGFSAKTLDRPQMNRGLELLATGEATTLVVTKLDRLTRSVGDFADLLDLAANQGWSLNVIELGVDTSTAAGKLVANVMMSVAQWERETIGERTSAALQRKKAEGHRLGRPVQLDDRIRWRIAKERAKGKSLRAIAQGLTDDGVKTARGGDVWHASTIKAVVGYSARISTDVTKAPDFVQMIRLPR